MTKTSKILSYLLLILAVVLVTVLWQIKTVTAPDLNNTVDKSSFLNIDFIFDKEPAISLQYPYSIIANENLLNATIKIAQEQNWPINSKNYGELGVLITQIGDKTNGEDNKYWQYYVNGQMPMVSVDKYLLQADDHIEWKFNKSEF